jgi:hypothetical protein
MRSLAIVLLMTGGVACGHVSRVAPSVDEDRREEPALREPSEDVSCLENGKTRIDGVDPKNARAIEILLRDAAASQPIISIVGHDDQVEARTGTHCGELSGDGSEFTLERRDGKWRIVKRMKWIS